MKATRVLETCLYVNDLDAAERFYREVLGLEFVSRLAGRHVFLRCGQSMVLLFNPDECLLPHEDFPPHGAHGQGHVAFAANDDALDSWRTQLEAQHVAIEKVIHWPQGGRSFYFRDPSGNSVELATPRIWGMPEMGS
jgi:catechol 2,3-dioxygenase-like lactoylglutathione lyase family enzyme